ncbi:LPS export ABC transporter permease LptF [Paenochrobactrum sp. BZR 588]|uniref:LPS export ABC transporter permease LptF n=1 Tax=Paenochrobactrum TaxID=999488 RepID=UPI0035BC7DFD
MRLIEWYILRRVAIMFLAVLGSTVGITWIVQILKRIDFLTTSGQSLSAILKFSSLLLPAAIPIVLPFALIIAITQTLSTMNQDSELVVINASGASRAAIVRPILLLALLVSMSSFVISNFVDPYSRMNMRAMLAEAGSDMLNVIIQEGTFRKVSDNLYVQIAERKPDGGIGGLFIADSRDPQIDLIYYAADGVIANNGTQDIILMKQGEVQRRDISTGNVSIIKFDSYSFDMSQFTDGGDDVSYYAKDRPLAYLLNPDANDPSVQTRPLSYKSELHSRFTKWLYPLVFAFIALVFAGDSRSHREARISASFSAITLALIVYWVGYYFTEGSSKEASYIKITYIVPIGTMLICAYLLISGRRLGLPDAIAKPLNTIFSTIFSLFQNLRSRFDGTAKYKNGGAQ